QLASDQGRLQVLLRSEVVTIAPDSVVMRVDGQLRELGNDAVVVCAGGVLPSALLRSMGIRIETRYGSA
ncbi:MAG: hypothetical protein KDI60_18305, partial [Xanthomonadales bacterium]|nr:hypothetical protein [Xanthomonadales bacterium]